MKKLRLPIVIIALVFVSFVFADQSTLDIHRQSNSETGLQYCERQSILAQKGDPEAMYILAHWGYNNCHHDHEKSFTFYLAAAKKGYAPAALTLGYIYRDGRWGIEKNSRNAAICFTQAASGKNAAGIANLGYMYHVGEGVEKDYVVAHALYKIAIPLDSSRSYYPALGLTYIAKAMTKADIEEADLLSKKLIKSDNFFITIEEYLNQHGKLGFNGKPLLAFELDSD